MRNCKSELKPISKLSFLQIDTILSFSKKIQCWRILYANDFPFASFIFILGTVEERRFVHHTGKTCRFVFISVKELLNSETALHQKGRLVTKIMIIF